jgi:hypothetical protein
MLFALEPAPPITSAFRLFQKPLVDMKLGFALMRDSRVPLRSKAFALLLGLAATGLVEFLEIPVEGILAAMVPILGIAGDLVIDGAEAIAGPLLLANALLSFVAPREIVDRIRSERATSSKAKSPIIDLDPRPSR